uniref:Uncharacterized protein n=1 Tax=Rhizophora mucronata TaxID=61149 RepID=A0A2P2MZQ7_RHIMU
MKCLTFKINSTILQIHLIYNRKMGNCVRN